MSDAARYQAMSAFRSVLDAYCGAIRQNARMKCYATAVLGRRICEIAHDWSQATGDRQLQARRQWDIYTEIMQPGWAEMNRTYSALPESCAKAEQQGVPADDLSAIWTERVLQAEHDGVQDYILWQTEEPRGRFGFALALLWRLLSSMKRRST